MRHRLYESLSKSLNLLENLSFKIMPAIGGRGRVKFLKNWSAWALLAFSHMLADGLCIMVWGSSWQLETQQKWIGVVFPFLTFYVMSVLTWMLMNYWHFDFNECSSLGRIWVNVVYFDFYYKVKLWTNTDFLPTDLSISQHWKPLSWLRVSQFCSSRKHNFILIYIYIYMYIFIAILYLRWHNG